MRDLRNLLLVGILLLGLFLRLFNLGVPVLHTDEAETYLASTNILESGFPRGIYNVPFYENAYIYKSDSEMYQFEPTNYYKTDLVLKKGWFTYYLVAFFSLFGDSEFVLRFPFAIIGVISLFFFFKLTKLLFNDRTALIASFFYAVSPSFLFYERMVRYYSPMLLFAVTSLYFWLKAFKSREKKYYIFGSVSLGLLFHTNILIFLSVFLAITIYGLLKKVRFTKNIKYSLIIIGVFVVPWMLGTGFLWNIAAEPISKSGGFSFFLQTVTAGINNQGSLYLLVYPAIVLLLLNVSASLPKKFRWKKDSSLLLTIAFLSLLFVPLFLAPASSYEQKLFLSLIPLYLIIISKLIDTVLNFLKDNNIKNAILIIFLLISFVHIETSLGFKGHNILEVKDLVKLERSDFYNKINTILSNKSVNNTLILSTSDHFPIMYYTNFSAQTIWPVRKNYIETYPNDIIVIENGVVEGSCKFFHQHVDPELYCGDNKNYIGKISGCEGFVLGETDTLYYCVDKRFFKGGGLGLFFPDFPENSPPDFIWDKVSFPLVINVDNMGESAVHKLKVMLAGDFSSEFYDSELDTFVFEETILPFESHYFSLGNLTYTPKLINRERIVDAGVKLCYSYATTLRITICEEDASICDWEVSGGPLQISTLRRDGMGFDFNLSEPSGGFLSDFDSCSSQNPKKIYVESDSFECDTGEFFSCKPIVEFEEGKSYFLDIIYDFQQEFNKAILLRSRELNEHDYENFVKS